MKRKIYSKLTLLTLLVITVSLSSCLKDKNFIDLTKNTPLVELPLAAFKSNAVQKIVYTGTAVQTLPVVVNLASPAPFDHDLTVTLAVDNTGLSSTYIPLPTSAYTVSSLSGVIPANARTATINFMINPAAVGTTVKNYALRVVIKDGSGVQISNYNTLVYNIQAQ